MAEKTSKKAHFRKNDMLLRCGSIDVYGRHLEDRIASIDASGRHREEGIPSIHVFGRHWEHPTAPIHVYGSCRKEGMPSIDASGGLRKYRKGIKGGIWDVGTPYIIVRGEEGRNWEFI